MIQLLLCPFPSNPFLLFSQPRAEELWLPVNCVSNLCCQVNNGQSKSYHEMWSVRLVIYSNCTFIRIFGNLREYFQLNTTDLMLNFCFTPFENNVLRILICKWISLIAIYLTVCMKSFNFIFCSYEI